MVVLFERAAGSGSRSLPLPRRAVRMVLFHLVAYLSEELPRRVADEHRLSVDYSVRDPGRRESGRRLDVVASHETGMDAGPRTKGRHADQRRLNGGEPACDRCADAAGI